MPAAPKPGWIVLAYFVAQFLVGVFMIDVSYNTPSLLDFWHDGLTWLFMTNVLFFCAPWVHQIWFSSVIVVVIPISIVAAWLRLKGWMRLIAIISLLACLNAYGFYVTMLTGG